MPVSSVVARVEAWACVYPVPRPFSLGSLRIERREYAVARVTADDGTQGVAYSLSRNAPLDLVLTDLIAPKALGHDAVDPAGAVEQCERGLVAVGTEGIVRRALSLLDVCLWDISGRAAGEPVWRLLGGGDWSEAPVLLVEGYPHDGESIAAFAERLAARAQEGYRILKLANLPDPADVAARLRATREAAGCEVDLVVDVAWAWRDVEHAVEAARLWEPHRLAWIEDPFPPQRVDAIAALRESVETPIAAGDDVTSRALFGELMHRRAVDTIRMDAMTIGGFTGFAQVQAQAHDGGFPISTHVHPEIHQHCAFGLAGVGPVEMFPRGTEFDCVHEFVLPASLSFAAPGIVRAPDGPGLGLELDWDSIEAHAVRHSSVEA